MSTPRVYVLDEYELAARLRISVRTVQYWRRKQVGPPHFKAGRHVRYAISDVEAWIVSTRHANGLPDRRGGL